MVPQAFVLPLDLPTLLFHAELASSPSWPSLLDSHAKGRSSLESLKRAREVLETPLALRLDVLAGPARNKSYTTDPGVTQVSHVTVHMCCTPSLVYIWLAPACGLLLGTEAPVVLLRRRRFL